ncbi:hypothetical protein DBR21_16420, partial [Caulobacter sp. HMWF009]
MVSGTDGFDRLQGVERLAFSDQTVTTASAATALWLQGTASAETLTGGTGDDVLTGGLGDDTLIGGAGDDVAVFAGLASGYEVSQDAASGDYRVVRSADGTVATLHDIERLT